MLARLCVEVVRVLETHSNTLSHNSLTLYLLFVEIDSIDLIMYKNVEKPDRFQSDYISLS